MAEQAADPGKRPLQRRLAAEITTMVHSQADTDAAIEASSILFGNNVTEALHKLDEATLLDVFEGVPQFEIERQAVEDGTRLVDLLVENAPVFASKSELRKLIQSNAISVNKEKVTDPMATVSADMLLNDRYILIQKGKKNYFLIHVKD